ncbi:hypothetical protein FOMG_18113 [Fusarium oxysporum f. sp. melonis 26406]|uniref:Enoyl reductase (ER) domain-containing protein n=1 Tax=Fusarium oxysporum f. sp. melonis 26406 TaxID=1089452 RepID=W9ZAB9_FUSOX|nr:hypothetical protein FOMG_18113 [Fusarium oxysporum f. sp. melonis 26406]
MKAVGVSAYGSIDNFESRDVPRPASPTGRDVLIKVEACSVNPIDTKIRAGIYDDAPDYYKFAPKGFHIIGYDGAGTVLEVGSDSKFFKPGDDTSWVGATTRQGSYAEYQLVSEFHCAHKPKPLDFVKSASFGLTFGTAYQSLHHRLEIKPNENVGILIIREIHLPLSSGWEKAHHTLADVLSRKLDQWRRRSGQCCYPAGTQRLEPASSGCYCVSRRDYGFL